MDIWLSELEMEDSTDLFHQYYQTNPLDDSYSLDALDFQSFSSSESYHIPNTTQNSTSGSYIEPSHGSVERPAKQQKTSSWNSCTTDQQIITPKTSPSPSSRIISFDNRTSPPPISNIMNPKIEPASYSSVGDINFSALNYEDTYKNQSKLGMKRVGSFTRSPVHAQDHVIAERKRREKLSERFIALSTLLPGLKKMDKATVLEDAIKYLKKLQERVKTLEEQTTKKTIESATIAVRKYKISSDDETEISSSDENIGNQYNQYLPEIEARVADRDVLIRIHCEKKKGCVAYIISQIEKLGLTVVSSNVLPFGNSTLHVTVVAQMEVELAMTVKDLVKNLRLSLQKFM